MHLASPTVLGTAAIAVALTAGPLAAHDVWIVPDAFQVAADGPSVTAYAVPVSSSDSRQETLEVSWTTFLFPVSGTSTASTQGAVSDSASAVAAAERFRTALAGGDSATVLSLLAPDAIVLESGDVETRAEYRSHHLPADIEYARAVAGTHTLVSVVVHGDAAWVSSTSISQGRFKDRAVNSAGAELIVLSRRDRDSPWQIRAIHWSSHRRTP